MNIFIGGPYWMGQWTEVAADALRQLGHTTGVFYHNRRGAADQVRHRLSLATRSIPGMSRVVPEWHKVAMARLARSMTRSPHGPCDLLLSIQGRLDPDVLAAIRRDHPDIRILYWIGDPLPAESWPIIHHAELIDHFLLFSEGLIEAFCNRGIEHTRYFPFGVSRRLHAPPDISPRDRRRFTCDVSFVGTNNPQRAELLRYLNQHLNRPVRLWGRGWRKASGLRGRGRLTMQQSLKVHACSRIALNIHAPRTVGGLNIRFYEIPAVGGFQITDDQSAIQRTSVRNLIPSYRTPDELVELVHHYLANEDERRERARQIQEMILQHETYEERFSALFRELELDG